MIDATFPPSLLIVSSSLVPGPPAIVPVVVASALISVVTRSSFAYIGTRSPFGRSPFIVARSPFVGVATGAVAVVVLLLPSLTPPTRRPTGDGGR